MQSPSRRTLLTAAAAMAAATPALAAPVRGDGQDVPEEDGVLVLPSRARAQRTRVPAGTGALLCTGYARSGDRGQALYARVEVEPAHAGKFRSADGAWWELAEDRLNPFMFGAKADRRTDDAPAIQAMFDFIAITRRPHPVTFLGGRYRVATGLTLPTIPDFVTLDVDGGGATIMTDAPVTIFSRIPRDQAHASVTIGQSHYDVHHFIFQGSRRKGQVGLHIGAAYSNLVRNCRFSDLEYGSIGSFCLGSAWRDNLYHLCSARALVLQTGTGYDQGPVWPGTSEPESSSHVNVIENCRVFGHPEQRSAYGIFGSNAVRMLGCISEGHGANIDVHFDFQGSPTVKEFHVDTFHCECPNGALNFKIRATGKVFIDRLVRSYPAALIDAQGSVNGEIVLRGLSWFGNLPEATAKGRNPNGRWFYHQDGNGYGAASEAGRSSGFAFRFEDCMESAWEMLSDPKRWENGVLPYAVYVRGQRRANGGMMEWSNAPIRFQSPISFADDSVLSGMLAGTVRSTLTRVPANASVEESFEIAGLLQTHHSVTLHPQHGDFAPPPGVMWNAWLARDGAVTLRLTNVTGREVALRPNAVWTYSAPRR